MTQPRLTCRRSTSPASWSAAGFRGA